MRTIGLAALVSFLVLSGLALASQSSEQKDRPSMMEHMMKGEKSMEGMSGTEGMMRMMKMMDQCSAMMESVQSGQKEPREGDKK